MSMLPFGYFSLYKIGLSLTSNLLNIKLIHLSLISKRVLEVWTNRRKCRIVLGESDVESVCHFELINQQREEVFGLSGTLGPKYGRNE